MQNATKRGGRKVEPLLLGCSIACFLVVLLAPVYAGAQLKKTHLGRADRELWNDALKIPHDCEESFAKTEGRDRDYSGLEFHRLNPAEYLVSVECYPGAYQPGGIFYLLRERPTRSATLLKFVGFDSQDDDGNPLPYSVVDGLSFFNRRANTLEIFSKSRGMGDCGQFARYRYKAGKFTLLELREQECKETGDLGSTDYRHWPLVKNP